MTPNADLARCNVGSSKLRNSAGFFLAEPGHGYRPRLAVLSGWWPSRWGRAAGVGTRRSEEDQVERRRPLALLLLPGVMVVANRRDASLLSFELTPLSQ